MLCDKVFSSRKDNIRRHIRHLHADVEKNDISNKIETIQDDNEAQHEDDDFESTDAQIGGDDDEDATALESSSFQEQKPRTPSPPIPVINNRVKVIQSIGNPNKRHQLVEQVPSIVNDQEVSVDPCNSQLPQKLQENEAENKLPPKKKAIALSHTTTATSAPPSKPRYDPIQHYRKMLLGFSNDHPTTNEDNIEDEDIAQEDQVFPVHWRKRTSQNFLFRR